MDGPALWFEEFLTSNAAYRHGVKELIFSRQTDFQSLVIADIGPNGRALFLDGKIQTAEGDEAHYHEPIVHVPSIAFSSPSKFLILGGADGGSAREALRWRSTTHVTMVDIDGVVVDACQKYMTKIHRGALGDPRVRVVIDDANVFIKNNPGDERFDVVVCDLTDPMENSPSLCLFTVEFFSSLKKVLSGPRATISLQAGPASLVENSQLFPRVCATLRSVFEFVYPFQIFCPTYGSPLGMVMASDTPFTMPSSESVDDIMNGNLLSENRVLDGAMFQSLFGIPRDLRKAIEVERRVYSMDNTANAFGKGTQ